MFWNKNKKEDANTNAINQSQSFDSQDFQDPLTLKKDSMDTLDDLKIPTPDEFGLNMNQASVATSPIPNMTFISPMPVMQEEKKGGFIKKLFGAKKEKQVTPPLNIDIPKQELDMSQMPPLPDLDIPGYDIPNQKDNNSSSSVMNLSSSLNSNSEKLKLSEIPSPETISLPSTPQVKQPESITLQNQKQEQKPAVSEPKLSEPKKDETSKTKEITTKKAANSVKQKSEADIKESEVKAEIASQEKIDKKITSSNIRKDKLLKDMLDDIETELLVDKKDIEEASKKITQIEKEIGYKDIKQIAAKKSKKKSKNKKTKINTSKQKVSKQKASKKKAVKTAVKKKAVKTVVKKKAVKTVVKKKAVKSIAKKKAAPKNKSKSSKKSKRR